MDISLRDCKTYVSSTPERFSPSSSGSSKQTFFTIGGQRSLLDEALRKPVVLDGSNSVAVFVQSYIKSSAALMVRTVAAQHSQNGSTTLRTLPGHSILPIHVKNAVYCIYLQYVPTTYHPFRARMDKTFRNCPYFADKLYWS
eukprot:GFKZ01011781.1.p1 GENE.GFKZ01011781.1~~GFKZ01011781.1.p1  ORF type:complete len:142 (+),score=1.91 GFKZ01011781.1:218-643(+)